MHRFIQEKRIFKQETNFATRYLLIPSEQIEKYIHLEYSIGIKRGDLLHPKKWIVFGQNAPKVFKKEHFNLNEYEVLFFPDPHLVRDIKGIISGHVELQLEKEIEPLLTMERLPDAIETPLRNVLLTENTKESELQVVEVFVHEQKGEPNYLVLHSELTDDDISYEYTKDFMDIYTVSEYKRENEGREEYLFKTVPISHKEMGLLHHSREERWYHLHQNESDYPFLILQEIYDMEEMVAFTSFQVAK